MINALYLITLAEGTTDDQKSTLATTVREMCDSITKANTVGIVPADSPTNAGDLFCEMAFRERTDYDIATTTSAWSELKNIASSKDQITSVTFLAYGPGDTNFSSDKGTCHRVMLMHLIEGVSPEVVNLMRQRVLQVGEYVPGLVNTQISKVFESSGPVAWDYVYDCDFDTPETFLGKYMASPYHWGYLRLVQSDCVECVADMQKTPYILTEKAFLTSVD